MDAACEREYAEGLRTGDADAWRGMYDLYAVPIWRFVARLMGPAAGDTADVVQEIFLVAARAAQTFDPERGTVWFWLCGIARRQVALHYRKHAQQQRVRQARARLEGNNGQLADWLEGKQHSPPELAASAELAVLVRCVLMEMPDDYGTLLTTRYLEGIPVEQIAEQEKSSVTAVRSKLARARRAFRDVFVKQSVTALEDL